MKAHHLSISNSESASSNSLYAFFLAVVLVIVADLACRFFLPEGWLVKIEDKTRERVLQEPAVDIQIVGDSVARSGIIAAALAADGFTVRNDAIPASGPIKTYLLLKSQFDRGRIPRVLVIAHSPHTFAQVRFPVVVGSFAWWSEIPGLWWESDDRSGVVFGVFTRMSYILRNRDSFRDLLTNGNTGFFRDYAEAHWTTDSERLAEYVDNKNKADSARPKLVVDSSGFYGKPFNALPMNDEYFTNTLALARQYRVPAFWITMPVPQAVYDGRSKAGYESALQRYLQKFVDRNELTVLRSGFEVYEDRDFRDPLHLSTPGAVRLACELRGYREIIARAVEPVPAQAHSVPRASGVDSNDFNHMRREESAKRVLSQVCGANVLSTN